MYSIRGKSYFKKAIASLCIFSMLIGISGVLPLEIFQAQAGTIEKTSTLTVKLFSGTTSTTVDTYTLEQFAAVFAGDIVTKEYSAVDQAARKFIYQAEGVPLEKVLQHANISSDNVSKIICTATDDYATTVQNPFANTRYYYPNLFTDSTTGATAVVPLLASKSLFNQSTTTPPVSVMDDSSALMLCMGQQSITEANRSMFSKCIKEIDVYTSSAGSVAINKLTSDVTLGTKVSFAIEPTGLTTMDISLSDPNGAVIDSKTGVNASGIYTYDYTMSTEAKVGEYTLTVSSNSLASPVTSIFELELPDPMILTGTGITPVTLTYNDLQAMPQITANYSMVNDNGIPARKIYAVKGVKLSEILAKASLGIDQIEKITLKAKDGLTKEITQQQLQAVRYYYPSLGSDAGKIAVEPCIGILENNTGNFTSMYASKAPRFFIGQESSAATDKTGDSCVYWINEINITKADPTAPVIKITSPTSGQVFNPGLKVKIKGTAQNVTSMSAIVTDPAGKSVYTNDDVTVTDNAFTIKTFSLDSTAAVGSYLISLNAAGLSAPATMSFMVQKCDSIYISINGNTTVKKTMADLQAMEQVETIYTTPDCVDTIPVPIVHIRTKGVNLMDLLASVGVRNFSKISFTATDGYNQSYTKEDLIDTPHYYFPNYTTVGGSSDGAITVEPVLALSEYWDYLDGSPIVMTDGVAPRLYMGEKAYGEQTTGFLMKCVNRIEVTKSVTQGGISLVRDDNNTEIADSTEISMSTGDKLKLNSSVYDENGNLDKKAKVVWSSDNENVLTISSGKLKAGTMNGKAVITAIVAKYNYSTSFTVNVQGAESYTMSLSSSDTGDIIAAESTVTLKVGDVLPLTLTLYDGNNDQVKVTKSMIKWTSSSKKVAAYNTKKGLIAAKAGTAAVTCTVKVKKVKIALTFNVIVAE